MSAELDKPTTPPEGLTRGPEIARYRRRCGVHGKNLVHAGLTIKSSRPRSPRKYLFIDIADRRVLSVQGA